MFQGLSPQFQDNLYEIVFPGSEIPDWFSHQCMGDEVNIMEPFSHLCNECIGIAFCHVICSSPHPQNFFGGPCCILTINGHQMSFGLNVYSTEYFLSDHIWLSYCLPQCYSKDEDRKSLWGCDANGFCEIGIKVVKQKSNLVKKCGLRVVYKKDIEDFNRTMAQCSNNSIIPYKGLDLPLHYFNNSVVVVEGNQKD